MLKSLTKNSHTLISNMHLGQKYPHWIFGDYYNPKYVLLEHLVLSGMQDPLEMAS